MIASTAPRGCPRAAGVFGHPARRRSAREPVRDDELDGRGRQERSVIPANYWEMRRARFVGGLGHVGPRQMRWAAIVLALIALLTPATTDARPIRHHRRHHARHRHPRERM